VPRNIQESDLEEIFQGTNFIRCRVSKIKDEVVGFVEYSTERAARHGADMIYGTSVEGKEIRLALMLKKPKKNRSKTHLHIANISYDAESEELKNALNAFNPISVTIKRDRDGSSKGFGYAEFSEENCQKLVETKDFEFKGRILKFAYAYAK